MTHRHAALHARAPRSGPAAEDEFEDDTGLELPVDPDDGSLIPDDDERVVNVPS